MDWERENQERLAEAQRLRLRMEKLGQELLYLRHQERKLARERARADERYEDAVNKLQARWVWTPEAIQPDPATGKSNQRWRDALGREAQRKDETLRALGPPQRKLQSDWYVLEGEISACGAELARVDALAKMLTAELYCLAGLATRRAV